jgi:CheY-like chemotaxis protein
MNESSLELKKILLVEDSPYDTKLTLAALQDARLANEVVVVRDGEEALDYLFKRGLFATRQNGLPGVVLLDLKLPKLTGLEVLEALRKSPETEHLPIVMLTSSREEQDVARSYRLGVNGYVVKPVAAHEFLEAIKEVGLYWGVINNPPVGCKGHGR